MTAHDGNGWKRCGLGHRHWGRHGAAGLLIVAPGPAGAGRPGSADQPVILLQLRSRWVSHGGTWAPPGGARDSHESAAAAAVREAVEECAVDPAEVEVFGIRADDHGGWSYQTVLASASRPVPAAPVSEETKQVAWVPVEEVERLRLHPGFAGQWGVLRTGLLPVTVIVDAANVVGSRPDGWWRDRAGAAERLIASIAELAARGLPGLPDSVTGLAAGWVADPVTTPAADPGADPDAEPVTGPVTGSVADPVLSWWYPRFVVVLEGGAARAVPGPSGGDGRPPWAVRPTVVRAPGSGDDEIVRQAVAAVGPRLVVTADRELRARCEAAGARVTGPRWLLGLL